MCAKHVINNYVDKGENVELHIYDKNEKLKGIVLFSKKHLNTIRNYNWAIYKSRKKYYTHAHIGNCKYIKMHRLIAEILYGESNESVDHINRDGLDNRDENLRYANNSVQGHNKDMFNHNTSGVKGVSFNKIPQKWRAEIQYNKKKFVKFFSEFEDAVNQRRTWEEMIKDGTLQ